MRAEMVFGNGGGIFGCKQTEKFARKFFVSKRTARRTTATIQWRSRVRSVDESPTTPSPRNSNMRRTRPKAERASAFCPSVSTGDGFESNQIGLLDLRFAPARKIVNRKSKIIN